MDINELRAEVMRRQKAAQRKVARLRRNGVNLSGTPYDVRRDPANIKRYNARQLTKYLGELNNFTSRNNSFVGGVEGSPIKRNEWLKYKAVEKAYLQKANANFEAVKDTYIPLAGTTVGDFETTMRPKPGKGRGALRPLERLSELQPYQIVGERQLAKLRKSLEGKLSDRYLNKSLKFQKYQMLEAVKLFGDIELLEKASALTDEQFDTLWNYTDAPRDLFSGYVNARLLSTGGGDEASANIHEDSADDTKQWIEWAAGLPPRQNRKNRR